MSTITTHKPVRGYVEGNEALVAPGTFELVDRYVDPNHNEEAIVVRRRTVMGAVLGAVAPSIKFYVCDLPARVALPPR